MILNAKLECFWEVAKKKKPEFKKWQEKENFKERNYAKPKKHLPIATSTSCPSGPVASVSRCWRRVFCGITGVQNRLLWDDTGKDFRSHKLFYTVS